MATVTLWHDVPSTPLRRAGLAPEFPSLRGLATRLWRALARSRRTGEEEEIARYIEMRGGRFTDALERDVERRFMRGRF